MIPQLLRQRDPIEEELLQQLRLRYRTGAQGTLPPGVGNEAPSQSLRDYVAANGATRPIPRRMGPNGIPLEGIQNMYRDIGRPVPSEYDIRHPDRTPGPSLLNPSPEMQGVLGQVQSQPGVLRIPAIPPDTTGPRATRYRGRPESTIQNPSLWDRIWNPSGTMEPPPPRTIIGPPSITERAPPEPGIEVLPKLMRERAPRPEEPEFSDVSEGSGSSPAQEALIDDEKRASRINKLNMLKAIAEGSGRIGDAFVEYGDRMARRPIQKARDYTAGINEAIAREEDKIPKSLTEKLREAGYNMPEGVTFEQFQATYPAIASMERAQSLSARADDVNARFDERNDLLDRRRVEDAFSAERKGAMADPLYRKATEGASAADSALSLLELSDNPQAISAAMVAVAKASGDAGVLSNQDITRWEGTIGIPGFFFNGLPKTFTGNFSSRQIAGLKEAAQTMGENNRRKLQSIGSTRMKTFGTANRDLLGRHGKTEADIQSAFQDLYGGAKGGMIRVVSPEGESGDLPEEDWPEAEAAGYTRQ